MNFFFFFFFFFPPAIIPFAPGAQERRKARASNPRRRFSPYYRISNALPSVFPGSLPPSRDFLRRLLFPLALTSFSIKLPTFNRHPNRRGIIPFACIYARGRPTATTCRQCGNKTSTDSYGHSSHDPKPSLESIHRDIDRRFTRRCIRQTGFSAILGTVSKPTAGSRKRPILLVARPPPPPRLLDYGWQKPSAEQCGIRRMHPPNSCCGTRDAPFLSSR